MAGRSGTLAWSDDGGRSWTEASAFSEPLNWVDVKWCGGRFVALTYTGAAWSADGDRWEAASRGPRQTMYRLACGGGRFVAVGQRQAIFKSPDGDRWDGYEGHANGPNLYGVAYVGGRFFAVGSRGTILRSSDADQSGLTWTRAGEVSVTRNTLYGVAWGGGRFVAVGRNGTILRSSDGDQWTEVSGVPTEDHLRGVAWDGAQFIAVGDGGTILHSTNGDRWTTQRTAGLTAGRQRTSLLLGCPVRR